MQKRKIRNDDEWLKLITQCRTSGMSDKSWCEDNGINASTFYYAIRRLQRKACRIPCSTPVPHSTVQEVVPIDFDHLEIDQVKADSRYISDPCTAIKIRYRSIDLEITNSASSSIIRDTIASLLALC